jgi:hypothetical protein
MPLGSTIVPAGHAFYFKLVTSSQTYTYEKDTNGFTDELFDITSPTDYTLAHYTLGSTLTVSWNLPTTFPIANIQLFAQAYDGAEGVGTTNHCSTFSSPVFLTPTTTSGTIAIPNCGFATTDHVDIKVAITGMNGEDSMAIAVLK